MQFAGMPRSERNKAENIHLISLSPPTILWSDALGPSIKEILKLEKGGIFFHAGLQQEVIMFFIVLMIACIRSLLFVLCFVLLLICHRRINCAIVSLRLYK